jgi:hypothetical protein
MKIFCIAAVMQITPKHIPDHSNLQMFLIKVSFLVICVPRHPVNPGIFLFSLTVHRQKLVTIYKSVKMEGQKQPFRTWWVEPPHLELLQ